MVINRTKHKESHMNSTLINKKTLKLIMKPTEQQLSNVAPLWNAIDTLIVHNCFIDQNPMKKSTQSGLCWDWVIIEVNGINIPAPIHTCSKTHSELYDYNDKEVILTNEECAYTTAYYYLDILKNLSRDWEQAKQHIHPVLKMIILPGVKQIGTIDDQTFSSIMITLRDQLTEKGWKVLD